MCLVFSSIYRLLLCSQTGPRHVLHSDTSTPSTSLQTVVIFPLVTTGAKRYFTGMYCHACIPNLSRLTLSHSICITDVVRCFPFDNFKWYAKQCRRTEQLNIFYQFLQVKSLHGLVECTTGCMRSTVEPTSHLRPSTVIDCIRHKCRHGMTTISRSNSVQVREFCHRLLSNKSCPCCFADVTTWGVSLSDDSVSWLDKNIWGVWFGFLIKDLPKTGLFPPTICVRDANWMSSRTCVAAREFTTTNELMTDAYIWVIWIERKSPGHQFRTFSFSGRTSVCGYVRLIIWIQIITK